MHGYGRSYFFCRYAYNVAGTLKIASQCNNPIWCCCAVEKIRMSEFWPILPGPAVPRHLQIRSNFCRRSSNKGTSAT